MKTEKKKNGREIGISHIEHGINAFVRACAHMYFAGNAYWEWEY